jgi:DNA adenine methylase
VIASNQATPRIVALYKSLGFVLYLVKGPRMISCNGDRRRAREILALKNM